jgi:hypothetical protein
VPVQNRVESHFKELTFKFRGNRIVGVRGFNIPREEKIFNEELLELYSLPVGFNTAAYYDRICQAVEKENECFVLVKDWIADFNLYTIGKLPLPDADFDGYFMGGLNKIHTKYLLGGRLKISNWKERNGKRIDGEFIKLFTSLLAAKRNSLVRLKDALFELQKSKTGSEEVSTITVISDEAAPNAKGEIASIIEKYLDEVRAYIPKDYEKLCRALEGYFSKGFFPQCGKINIAKLNKKKLGKILNWIFREIKPNEKMTFEYVEFASKHISTFEGVTFSESDFRKCNLYNYIASEREKK